MPIWRPPWPGRRRSLRGGEQLGLAMPLGHVAPGLAEAVAEAHRAQVVLPDLAAQQTLRVGPAVEDEVLTALDDVHVAGEEVGGARRRMLPEQRLAHQLVVAQPVEGAGGRVGFGEHEVDDPPRLVAHSSQHDVRVEHGVEGGAQPALAVLYRRLGTLLLRDVREQREEVLDRAVGGALTVHAQVHVDRRAVLAEKALLETVAVDLTGEARSNSATSASRSSAHVSSAQVRRASSSRL